MSKLAILIILVVISVGATSAGAAGRFLAADFAADNSGRSDATMAIQTALDACAEAGGGVVLLENGHYRCDGSLTLPTGVALEGVWEMPHHGALPKGTVLMAYGGRGDETATPFINLSESSAVRGLTFWYPEQKVDAIVPYPWTVQGRAMHGTVENCTLVNSYRGIDFGTHHGELHVINHVYGCILRMGVMVDQCTDIGRISNVHFNPHYWARAGDPVFNATANNWGLLADYVGQNSEGFVFGRTDWEFVTNCFTIFNKYCFRFADLGNGGGNVVVTQSGGDISPCAFRIEASQPHSGHQFVNCQVMGLVEVTDTNTGPIKFTNCGFWPVAATGSQVTAAGPSAVILNGCHFAAWGDAPCVDASNARLTVTGCYFAQNKPHIRLGEGMQAAIIGMNQCAGGLQLENLSTGDLQVGLNSAQ